MGNSSEKSEKIEELKKVALASIAKLVRKTHFMNQDFFIGDVLSPQSIERRILLAKPERYSILREHTFDCVLSHRRSFVVDRLLLIRDEEELKENGWFYTELSLTCESLGLRLDLVNATEEGVKNYLNRIIDGEILSYSGDPIEGEFAFPKAYINKRFLKMHEDLNRCFQRWKLCPECGSKLKLMESDQPSHFGKRVYICTNKPKCDFHTIVPELPFTEETVTFIAV